MLFQPGAAKGRERVAWGISPGEAQGFGKVAPVGFMEIGETKWKKCVMWSTQKWTILQITINGCYKPSPNAFIRLPTFWLYISKTWNLMGCWPNHQKIWTLPFLGVVPPIEFAKRWSKGLICLSLGSAIDHGILQRNKIEIIIVNRSAS